MKRVLFLGTLIFILFLGTLIFLLINSVSAYETYYYHTDNLGSPVVITDENASVVWSANYEPFGKTFNEVSTDDNNPRPPLNLPPTPKHRGNSYQYNAKEKDNSGLYYYGARYYDADLGRFTTADTIAGNIEQPPTLNRYVYTLNNPLKYIDLRGNAPTIPYPYSTLPSGYAYDSADKIWRHSSWNAETKSYGLPEVRVVHRSKEKLPKDISITIFKKTSEVKNEVSYSFSGIHQINDETITEVDIILERSPYDSTRAFNMLEYRFLTPEEIEKYEKQGILSPFSKVQEALEEIKNKGAYSDLEHIEFHMKTYADFEKDSGHPWMTLREYLAIQLILADRFWAKSAEERRTISGDREEVIDKLKAEDSLINNGYCPPSEASCP